MTEQSATIVIPEGFPTDEWTNGDVLRYLISVGRKITDSTWTTYVSRGQAPAPLRHVGRTPVFSPVAVITWHLASQGPGRPRTQAATKR
jgi:hypothetical protein